jgi:cytochrome c
MSLEFNKVAGAVLGSLVFVMGVGFVADLIFSVEHPEEPGYQIAVAEDVGTAEAAPAAAEVEPIAVRLAAADVARGEALGRGCVACHTLDASDTNKVGPGLWNLINRPAGVHGGFTYSSAMVEFGQNNVWDYEHLDAFIAAPRQVVSGTKMAYAGMRSPEDRANLIAFLRTLADNPEPLPEVEAAAEAPAAEAPAEAAPELDLPPAPAEMLPEEPAPAE